MRFVRVFFAATRHWFARDANIYAAALAYFAPFALIPMLAVAITLVGLMVGEVLITESLLRWGNAIAPDITSVLAAALHDFTWSEEQYWGIPFLGVLVIGWVLLSTLSLLVRGLHHIWYITEDGAWRQIELLVRSGIFFLLLLAFLSISVALSLFAPDVFGNTYFGSVVLTLMVFFLTVALFTVGFGMLVRNPLCLKSRLLGSVTIAVLLTVLRIGLDWWLAFTPAIDLFGAAGVLLGLLILVYAMTAIIYYGAAVAYTFEQQMTQRIQKNYDLP